MPDYPSKWLALGRALVPVRPGTRIPAMKEWTTAPVRTPEARSQWRGYSWGWALGPGDLVVDIDPRNGGGESLRQLNQLAGGSIFRLFPVVKTPRGGFHLYTRIPEGVKPKKAISGFKGVDFLAEGCYCLMPGESSEYGHYSPVPGSAPVDKPAPDAPPWLLDIIQRSEPVDGVSVEPGQQEGLTRSQLAGLLAQLPVDAFREHDQWLSMMQAAHDATEGRGMVEFVNWSTSDPEYTGAAAEIERRWKSFSPGKAGNVTAGTLIAEVLRRGGTVPRPTAAEAAEMLPDIPDEVPLSVGEVLGTPGGAVVVPFDQLRREILQIKKGLTLEALRPLIRDVMKHNPAERDLMLGELRAKSGYSKAHLLSATAGVIKGKGKDDNGYVDPASEVADMALQDGWDGTDYVLHAADQRFWAFGGKRWEPVADNIVEQALLHAATRWKQLNPMSKSSVPALMSGARKVLVGRLASRAELHRVDTDMRILNVRNGEIHLNADTGETVLQEHAAKHWQTTLLKVDFDPDATCPRFDQFLRETFSPKNAEGQPSPVFDVDAVIRYLWELIGYTIQPVKDIAAWVLLTGSGANGKSTLINIITALLGEHAVSTQIAELVDDAHGTSILPGKLLVVDEDLDLNFRLPDGFIKKISENKMMTANPKFQHPYSFMNTSIIWMAANSTPQTRDLSPGMMRRAHVIPFKRHFAPREQDRGLASYVIKHELPGILAGALRGLRRLRARGYFDLPETVTCSIDEWAKKTSAVASWQAENLTHCEGKTLLQDLYSHYRQWAQDCGHDKKVTLHNFKQSLKDSSVTVRKSTGNRDFAFGVRLANIDPNEDVPF